MSESRRKVRSYVLREGRITPAQRRALQDLWPSYGLLPAQLSHLKSCFTQQGCLTVEIGFGMGDSLLTMAEARPEDNFLGMEVHRPGIGHLLMGIEASELTNLLVTRGDAEELLEKIPSKTVDRLQVFFPDPWPKKKHHKRRLLSEVFLLQTTRLLVTGGILHIATDWLPYAEEIALLCDNQPLLEATEPPPRPVTKYEQRGQRLGHSVTDLAYRLVS